MAFPGAGAVASMLVPQFIGLRKSPTALATFVRCPLLTNLSATYETRLSPRDGTSNKNPASVRNTWRKRCRIAAWTGITGSNSNAYVLIPEARILHDEFLHELNAFFILQHVDANALAPHVVFGAEEIPVLANNYVRDFV